MAVRETWDEYYMGLAKKISERSKDRSTKVGAIIVGPDKEIRSTGYNGFARGVDDEPDERHERPTKYLITPHAEMNAITNAARCGTPTKGCKIYVTSLFPCSTCAALIINAGITEVIVETLNMPERWAEDGKWAKIQFKEAGIPIRLLINKNKVEE
jgi:dCMP deaminase